MTAYLYDRRGDYVGFVGVDMAAGEPEPVYPATMDVLVPHPVDATPFAEPRTFRQVWRFPTWADYEEIAR